jgi:small subunit ribosomal protein S18
MKKMVVKKRTGSRDKLKRPRFKTSEDGMPLIMRKKFCRFCKDKTSYIDYKDLNILEKMISEKGKMSSRRSTGNCARHQRIVARAVKRARYVSLIPYTR